jgi:hypothetical protein
MSSREDSAIVASLFANGHRRFDMEIMSRIGLALTETERDGCGTCHRSGLH